MKKSRRLIRNTLLVLGAAVVLYVAASRWHATGTVTPEQRSVPTASDLALLRDFNSVVVSGNLAVEIVQQAGYSVEFTPGTGAGAFSASTREHALVLAGFRNPPGYRVRIGMPALTKVSTEGAAALAISGFDGDALVLQLDGDTKVTIRNSPIRQWHVVSSGSSVLQLDRISIAAGKVDLVGRATLTVVD